MEPQGFSPPSLVNNIWYNFSSQCVLHAHSMPFSYDHWSNNCWRNISSYFVSQELLSMFRKLHACLWYFLS